MHEQISGGETPVLPVRGRAGVSIINIHELNDSGIKKGLELSDYSECPGGPFSWKILSHSSTSLADIAFSAS